MSVLSRRGLIGALICAPAIVRASSLMPIKSIPWRKLNTGVVWSLSAVSTTHLVPWDVYRSQWYQDAEKAFMSQLNGTLFAQLESP